ncbi:hypothetical protein BZARG_2741 [Bizionia argentinensis JUB59]|uniref:DUF4258 domain-containing protein n=1 Tax=Bizionia argentinensis JUB59 TaxID=1046627 RepID=G2ED17_9FLAO|nr:hypothetical protein [Bizionia argentinensis]EGV43659.1 hypothetical protein BZARG_2741 [Bizionia argentinensis JUB59]
MNNQNTETLNLSWEVTFAELNKSETLSFNHSKHSFKRSNQRNIGANSIALTIEYGTAFFKQGLIFYVLGENNLPKSINRNARKKSTNLIVVVAGDSNTILTCYRSKNPYKHIKKKQKNISTKPNYAA